MLYVNHQKTTIYSITVVSTDLKTFPLIFHELDSLFFIVKNPCPKNRLPIPK